MELFNGKLKFDLNAWDITKSIIAVIALIYAISFMDKAERFMNTPKQQWDKTTIEAIASGVVKAQVAESNKDLKAAIKALQDNSVAIQTAQDNDEKIKELGHVVARIEDNTVSLKGELEKFINRPTATLDTAVVRLKDADGQEYGVATARYSPDVPEGIDRWSFNTWPRTITADIVVSEDDEGRPNRYVELYTQSDWEQDPDKRFTFKIIPEETFWVKGEEATKKFRFAPRIGFSSMFGTEAIVPALDYSLFSYGRTKIDMSWRFLDVGVGGNKESISLSLTPVSYNLGDTLPVISNMFIGPYIGWEIGDPTYSFGLSTSIPF